MSWCLCLDGAFDEREWVLKVREWESERMSQGDQRLSHSSSNPGTPQTPALKACTALVFTYCSRAARHSPLYSMWSSGHMYIVRQHPVSRGRDWLELHITISFSAYTSLHLHCDSLKYIFQYVQECMISTRKTHMNETDSIWADTYYNQGDAISQIADWSLWWCITIRFFMKKRSTF